MNLTHRGQEQAGQPGRGWEDSGLLPTPRTHQWCSLSRGKPLCPEEWESGLGVDQELQERTGPLGLSPAPWYHFCLAHLSSCIPLPRGAWVPVEELRPGAGGGPSPSTDQDEWAGTRCPPLALRRGVCDRALGGRCRQVGLPTAGACTGVRLCVLLSCTHMQVSWHTNTAVCVNASMCRPLRICTHVFTCHFVSVTSICTVQGRQAAWVGSAYTGEDVQVAFCVSEQNCVQMYTSVSVCTYTHMYVCTDQCMCMRACINPCVRHRFVYTHVSLNLLCVPRYAGTSVCPCGPYTGVCHVRVSVPVCSAGCCP